MNVLLTGHLGYIGTVLSRMLHQRGYSVVGLDTGYFSDCLISEASDPPASECLKDIRDVDVDAFRGIDGVIHLAALSDDPSGRLNPRLTNDINYLATVNLALKAREAGGRRFIFSSSCSTYGAADGHVALDENAPFNPVSEYARSKIMSESGLSKLADGKFSPIFLRNATAYGFSPRLRFDLVLNNLVGWAITTGKVCVKSDGTPWRPLVHVGDICGAFIAALEAPREAVHNEAFNVGQDSENFRVSDIAEIVKDTVPGCSIEYTGEIQDDRRSYRVCFEKIRQGIPGFQPRWTLREGANQLYRVLRDVRLTFDSFQDRRFTRLLQLKHLIETDQVDGNLFWNRKREKVAI